MPAVGPPKKEKTLCINRSVSSDSEPLDSQPFSLSRVGSFGPLTCASLSRSTSQHINDERVLLGLNEGLIPRRESGRDSLSLMALLNRGMTESSTRPKIFVATAIFISLLIAPAPLLPPAALTEVCQQIFGVGWEMAYLVSAVVVQTAFYASIGALSSFLIKRSASVAGQALRLVFFSAILICGVLFVRSVKAGHLPALTNILVPLGACVLGAVLGSGLRHRQRIISVLCACIGIGLSMWALRSYLDPDLRSATVAHLEKIGAIGSTLPSGDARFLALLQVAFEPVPTDSTSGNLVQRNRAAILAWGIAMGHPALARFVGVDPQSQVVRRAGEACENTTLCGRSDWPRHYALSAALAILQHPFVSDAGGLMKEQLDTLTRGSGFSFGDLAADRAGVRFAISATQSEKAAGAMRARILKTPKMDDFFPSTLNFPENLTLEEFRNEFGGVGSKRYRIQLRDIEVQLDRCIALSATPS